MLAADGRPLKASLAPRAPGAEAARADADRAAARLRPRQLPLPDRRHAACARSRTRSSRTPCRAPSRRWPTGTRRAASCPASRSSPRCTTTSSSPSRTRPTPASAQRLNYEYSGMSSLMRGVGRDVKKMDPAPALQGAVHRGRQEVGRPAGLADDQALLRPLHLGLPPERRSTCSCTPDGIAAQAAGRAHLPQALPAHRGDEPRDHLRSASLLGYPIAYLLASPAAPHARTSC